MKKSLLIVFIFLSVYSCKSQNQNSVWNAAYEAKWHKEFDVELITIFPNSIKRRDVVNYYIKRVKSELPGGMESIPADSLRRLCSKIGIEYGYSHPADASEMKVQWLKWTPEREETLKKALLTGTPAGELEYRQKVCNCVVIKLKKLYPDSIMVPFSNDMIHKVGAECIDEIKPSK